MLKSTPGKNIRNVLGQSVQNWQIFVVLETEQVFCCHGYLVKKFLFITKNFIPF